MDQTDVGILRSLGIQPFVPWPHGPADLKPSVIARRLGISVDAVRDRIARLESRGVISGYEITPNLRLFDLQMASYLFRLPESGRRKQALRDAESADGVCSVTGFLGPEACLDIAYQSPQDLTRRLTVVGRLLGDASPHVFYDYNLPRPKRTPTALDWRILQALRGRARRPLEEVASELGVTAKTARRRFDQMAKDGAFDIVAKINPGALSGKNLFILVLYVRRDLSPAEDHAIVANYQERWFFSGSPPSAGRRSIFVALLADSPGAADEMAREAETLPGVEHAEALVPVHLATTMAWVDDAIAQKIRTLTPATRMEAAPAATHARPQRR